MRAGHLHQDGDSETSGPIALESTDGPALKGAGTSSLTTDLFRLPDECGFLLRALREPFRAPGALRGLSRGEPAPVVRLQRWRGQVRGARDGSPATRSGFLRCT